MNTSEQFVILNDTYQKARTAYLREVSHLIELSGGELPPENKGCVGNLRLSRSYKRTRDLYVARNRAYRNLNKLLNELDAFGVLEELEMHRDMVAQHHEDAIADYEMYGSRKSLNDRDYRWISHYVIETTFDIGRASLRLFDARRQQQELHQI